jgi:hypothetical protein
MAKTGVLASAGLLVLGLIVVTVGALMEPVRSGATPGNALGESLIAIGLTLLLGSLGYILAWANPAT